MLWFSVTNLHDINAIFAVSGKADAQNVWSLWCLAEEWLLLLVFPLHFSSLPKIWITIFCWNFLQGKLKIFLVQCDKSLELFTNVCPLDIFLFSLQNHPGCGNKCSLHSATELVSMEPWVRGAGVLVLYVYSDFGFGFSRTWRWILAEEKTTQEHASAATTALMGRKTKASRRPDWPWNAERGFWKERRG